MEKADKKVEQLLEDSALYTEWTKRSNNILDVDFGKYTHTLKKPLERDGQRYETLSFDYSTLTGRDSLSIERDVMAEFKKSVTIPEYMPEYLVNMAARACTDRNEQGNAFVNVPLLLDLPLSDFREICASARRFLMASVL